MIRFVLAAALLASASAFAATETVVVLYTNDMHDHLLPDYDGQGGLPYVSGYVKSVKAERDDVIVLDAGDVMEKGDMVAYMTKSAMMYEAMGKIGYTAGAVGNHDLEYGVEHLHKCNALAPNMTLLCNNVFKDDGALEFPASTIVEAGGVRIGLIGLVTPRDENSMELEPTAHAVAKEAARIDSDVDLTFVVCHVGSKDSRMISAIAPQIDLFVSGHTHEFIPTPKTVDETGAIIVQSGQYTDHVGRIELTVDLETKKIVAYENELVPMRHDTIPVDEDMLAWILRQQEELCPQADDHVGTSKEEIGWLDLGRVGARALMAYSDADIVFCHPSRVMRDNLPAGDIDVNAIFRTGGTYGATVIRAQVTGAHIEAYLKGLLRGAYGSTMWEGFTGERDGRDYETDLDPSTTYTILMCKKEWDTRFLRVFEKYGGAPKGGFPEEDAGFSFTDAVAAYLKPLEAQGKTIDEHVKELQEEE